MKVQDCEFIKYALHREFLQFGTITNVTADGQHSECSERLCFLC